MPQGPQETAPGGEDGANKGVGEKKTHHPIREVVEEGRRRIEAKRAAEAPQPRLKGGRRNCQPQSRQSQPLAGGQQKSTSVLAL